MKCNRCKTKLNKAAFYCGGCNFYVLPHSKHVLKGGILNGMFGKQIIIDHIFDASEEIERCGRASLCSSMDEVQKILRESLGYNVLWGWYIDDSVKLSFEVTGESNAMVIDMLAQSIKEVFKQNGSRLTYIGKR